MVILIIFLALCIAFIIVGTLYLVREYTKMKIRDRVISAYIRDLEEENSESDEYIAELENKIQEGSKDD